MICILSQGLSHSDKMIYRLVDHFINVIMTLEYFFQYSQCLCPLFPDQTGGTGTGTGTGTGGTGTGTGTGGTGTGGTGTGTGTGFGGSGIATQAPGSGFTGFSM